MGKMKIFDVVEMIIFFYWGLIVLWMISGSWVEFAANLSIALVGVGLTFVSVYIIIGICKLVEDSLKGGCDL